MGHSIARIGAGCAGLAAGLALAATPALAAPASSSSLRPSGPARALPAAAPVPAASSQYFGGYDVVPGEGVTSDGATFKLPAIACPDTGVQQLDALGEWVNDAAGDFYQAGGATDAASSAVIECSSGEPVYGIDALTANGREQIQLTGVEPGDLIQTRVAELPTGDALATTSDLSTGQTVSSEATSLGDATQIYEGLIPDEADEVTQNSFSIPTFRSVLFTRSQVGALPLAQVDPTATDLAQSGPVMVAPSAIKAKTPGRFTLTEKSDQ